MKKIRDGHFHTCLILTKKSLLKKLNWVLIWFSSVGIKNSRNPSIFYYRICQNFRMGKKGLKMAKILKICQKYENLDFLSLLETLNCLIKNMYIYFENCIVFPKFWYQNFKNLMWISAPKMEKS